MKKYFAVLGLLSCIGLSAVNAPVHHVSTAATVVGSHAEPVRVAMFKRWPDVVSSVG